MAKCRCHINTDEQYRRGISRHSPFSLFCNLAPLVKGLCCRAHKRPFHSSAESQTDCTGTEGIQVLGRGRGW